MRYLLAGGGTGGHIYPALTIAEALRELDPQAEFLYVGTATGREADVVPKTDIPFATVASGGLINLGLAQKVSALLKVGQGMLQALGIVRRFRPDVIIGTGGFVCGPVYVAALLTGRPLVIQEQNAFPGVTNRIAARWAKKVFVPFEEAKGVFPKGAPIALVGNPVRKAVGEATREAGRKAWGFDPADEVVLISGGSGGARDFNRAAALAMQALLRERKGLRVIHMTGERYFQQVKDAYGTELPGLAVVPYIHNMPEAMAAADAGIFRAGAMLITEVQVRGLPSIFIPSPNVTHNHQEWNARSLERKGAAVVIREADLTPESLAQAVASLLDDAPRRSEMSRALRAMAQPDAAQRIAQAVMRLIQGIK